MKAALQNLFSRVPGGESLNHLFQKYVTHTLPIDARRLTEIVQRAGRHLDAIARHFGRPIAGATFYEFGAGWDLASPLGFWCHGVERQVLIDIRDLLRLDVLNHTIGLFAHVALPLRRRPGVPLASKEGLRSSFGIDFRAPCDARATALPPGAVDVITSSNTLEHVPPDDLRAILRECHRILAADGIMSMLVDYQDHYSYFDSNITPYNFLRYSERVWRRYNPSLHYQNRLRHSDYERLFRESGFRLLDVQPAPVGDADLSALRSVPLASRFAEYAATDLAVRDARFVLTKG
jgi:SAM-dependent methyltransferase